MSTTQPTDLDLLALRAEGLADRSIGVRFDRTTTGEALSVSPTISAELSAAIKARWDRTPHQGDPTVPPPLLAGCEQVLTAAGWNVRRGGGNVVYLVEPEVSFPTPAVVHRSDGPHPGWLGQSNPGNWEPTEWDELIDGRLGPWAMACEGRRVVSITHTPTPLTLRRAEAGAWTDPEFRGRGLAAAATAQWADVLRPSGRFLFYGTVVDNLSSQRVASRLGLRLIGYQWFIGNRALENESSVHPSSTLHP